jgi:hypothetical protein
MQDTKEKTRCWFGEIKWLSEHYDKFSVDELRILCHGRDKEMPKPAANLGNIFRSAQKHGLIEPTDEYVKSKWSKSSRVPRQYWRKCKVKEVA